MDEIKLQPVDIPYESEGQQRTWTAVAGIPLPGLDRTIDWHGRRSCECGGTLYVVYHRPDARGLMVYRVACKVCLKPGRGEKVVGEIDFGKMAFRGV